MKIVVIIGEMSCCICGEKMSQKDVDNGDAILTGSNPRNLTIIAHVRHFYIKEKKHLKTPDFDLNMAKIAFAVGEENGWLNEPEKRQHALNTIAQLEKGVQRRSGF